MNKHVQFNFMYTIKEMIRMVAENKCKTKNLWNYFGYFLDYLYNSDTTKEGRYELVKDEPEEFDNISERTYAFIAWSVHKICWDYDVELPKWPFKKKYFLEKTYFSMDAQGDLRLVLLAESPIPFRMRHIFTSANTLDRV